jgi:hypothetical protein
LKEQPGDDILFLREDGHAQAGSPGAITRRSVPVGRSSLTNSPLPAPAEVAGLWHHGIDLVKAGCHRLPIRSIRIADQLRQGMPIPPACNRGLGDER